MSRRGVLIAGAKSDSAGSCRLLPALADRGIYIASESSFYRVLRHYGLNKRRAPIQTASQEANSLASGDISAPFPNHSWVTDFTYVATWSGFSYVAFAIDLYSLGIVGWQVSTVKDTAFVEWCLKKAVWRRGPRLGLGMIHHSDAGSQGEFKWSQIEFANTKSGFGGLSREK